MDSIPGVTFVQVFFTEDAVYSQIHQAIGNHPVDLVISDMAPNMIGVKSADQSRTMYLFELVLDLATRLPASGAAFAAGGLTEGCKGLQSASAGYGACVVA